MSAPREAITAAFTLAAILKRIFATADTDVAALSSASIFADSLIFV